MNILSLLQDLVILKGFLLLAVIFHNNNFVIRIRTLFNNGVNTAGQILDMILIGNQNRNQRLPLNFILDAINRSQTGRVLRFPFQPAALEMVVKRLFGGSDAIGLRADITGHRTRMAAPEIQYLGDVHDMMGLFCQTQDDIIILAAVIIVVKPSGPVQKLPAEYGKMADIVIGPQIIYGKVRLTMYGQSVLQLF